MIFETLSFLRDLVWSPPLLLFLVSTGLYLTYLLGGVQFRLLGYAFRLLLKGSGRSEEGDISPFEALMTGLAGAVGTGSVAGIATAVMTGGYGALFWMWIIALVGMATSYAETFLSVRYRVHDELDEMCGGAMFTLERGVGSRGLALCFAAFGALASFGIGATVQSNSVADALGALYGVPVWITGVTMLVATALVVLGGIRSIGRVAGYLVPLMSVSYLSAGLLVLAYHITDIPAAFVLIIKSAFTGQAATGGFIGSTVMLALRNGVARGIFCNESGMGSSTIAAAAARTPHPAHQALLSMAGVFLSTCVICTITGLVLAVTDVQGVVDAEGNPITGAPLALEAFGTVFPVLRSVVVGGLVFFAYSTVLAWAYYGEKCVEYLFGLRAVFPYRVVYTTLVLIGVGLPLPWVWAFADIANGLMVIPNLIGVLALSHIVASETKSYFDVIRLEGEREWST